MNQNKKSNLNIWAAIFGPLYYIYKGLWKKALLLTSAILVIIGVVQWVFPTMSINGLSIGLNAGIYGTLANIDLNRKKRFKETVWKELPSIFNLNWMVIGVFVVSVIFSISTDSGSISEIEDASVDVVSQILQDRYDIPLEAVDVMILDETEGVENSYEARAILSNNSVINISIEYYPDRDNLYVFIPFEEVLLIY